MAEDEPPSEEQLLASAAQYLIDGGENDAASVLLACTLTFQYRDILFGPGDMQATLCNAVLSGPRAIFDILRQSDTVRTTIKNALDMVVPTDVCIEDIVPRATLVKLPPDWHTGMLEQVRGTGVHNQAVADNATRIVTWNGLRFRSESERRIAEALDRAGALYLPNCRARLGLPDARLNREPDFLVCHEGKWGILEVDGEPFHPPSRTVEDHERARLFKQHGIRVVEHFDATECYEAPQGVVKRFLDILKQF